ncbi:MAG: hypothetical protein ACLQBY_18325 [Solirubrobacteraceae bacterium]
MPPQQAPAALEATDVGATLVIPPEGLVELRLALLADIRSVGEELLAIIGEVESMAGGDEVAEKRRRCRDVTAAIKTRHELHEVVGWPGQPLAERTLTGHAHSALAIALLTRHRDTMVARLARHDLAQSEKPTVSETVGTLSAFRRDARVAPQQVITADSCGGPGQDGSCQR